MGLTNLRVMVPFCRRVEEGRRVIAAMARNGLKRGENGLEIYVMCEIPNNVIEIDNFAALFDGFSIGSNDLTQLTLGVDRDSEIVAFDFDERDPGMLEMLRLAVTGAKRNGRHVGICGEAPANYPEIARFLAELGIDSISVNAASLLRTMSVVYEAEQAKLRRRRVAPSSMPYPTLDDLPPAVHHLPRHAQEIFRAAFNAAWHSYADRRAPTRRNRRTGSPGRPSRSGIARSANCGWRNEQGAAHG